MVEIEFETDEYERMEKWFGLLFGLPGEKGKYKANESDIALFNKLSQMHMALLKHELREKNRLKDVLGYKRDDDDEE